jgi:hypothetical protein
MSATTMRKLIVGAVLLMAGALLTGCTVAATVGSGRMATEARDVSGFDAVEFAFIGDLNISQGEAEGLMISGDDNILPLIKTEVNNGVLRIYAPGVNLAQSVNPLRYELKVKDLRQATLSGVGNITAATLAAPRLKATVSGAGALRIDDLAADLFEMTLSGLGDATVGGAVDRLDVTLSGAGNFVGDALRSGVAEVVISGMGSASVWATETLDATISGAGSVTYTGAPVVRQQVTGMGSVSAASE